MTTEQKTASPTFEQAVLRLEQIVSELESGEPSLEEALALFEEGAKLREHCARQLDAAAEKVRLLTDGPAKGTTEGDEAD